MARKTFSIAGALAGLALYLALGALPAAVYGGYAGVTLVGWLFGTPVQVSLASRAVVLFSMASGVIGVGALFAAGGAMTGAAIGILAGPADKKPGAKVDRNP